MATCDVCGNDYWMSFEVRTASGNTYTFDSFECAMTKLAPVCEHCGCRIAGHGVEVSGRFYCCAHCARTADSRMGARIRDTVGSHPG
ncbi:Prokaryotic metallothionein [Actinophytocola sp.]|uniref:Prokaryotic metallothionein n=1 Tax=Actinophytocola sp. TaxID=1872138 RepID=UPI002ED53F0B